MIDGSIAGGIQLGTFPGGRPDWALNYMGLTTVSLSGTGNITIRSVGPRKTRIQINSLYVLDGSQKIGDNTVVTQWKFTTREPDTQRALVDFVAQPVTCRPSYKLEEDFLTEVSARL